MTNKVGDVTKLEDVYFYYTKIFASQRNKEEPDKAPQFSVQALVSEEQYDAFTEEFPKNGANVIKGSAKFKEKFKVDPPYEAPKYFLLTLKRKDEIKAKGDTEAKPLPLEYRPKTWMKNADGKLVDQSKVEVGNGSAGALSYSTFEVREGKFKGIYPQLKAIMVTNLVPYVSRGGNDGSEFGEVEGNGNEFAESAQSAPTSPPKASAAPTPKVAPKKPARAVVEASDESEDSPF